MYLYLDTNTYFKSIFYKAELDDGDDDETLTVSGTIILPTVQINVFTDN